MNIIKPLSFLFATSLFILLASCNNTPSLQRYFVDHQEAANFITQDIPISVLNIDQTRLTEAQKEAYKSVSRLNFLGYRATSQNTDSLKAELTTVKAILSQDQYNDLIEFSDKGNRIELKYIGTDDKAEEVVLFGSSPDKGFGIVRVLGNDMTPKKIITLVEVLQNSNIEKEQLEGIFNFFK
ncbi:MAG: DUF4252 domain-containing protein [Flavobacteriaceae bacterium]